MTSAAAFPGARDSTRDAGNSALHVSNRGYVSCFVQRSGSCGRNDYHDHDSDDDASCGCATRRSTHCSIRRK